MTLMFLRFPFIILLSVLCAILCAIASVKGKFGFYSAAAAGIGILILSSLVCMLPYTEIILLLLPSVFSAFLFGAKEDET